MSAALFAAVFVVYVLTFSSAPTSDSPTWILTIEQPDWDYLTLAAHPLPLYVVLVVRRGLAALGVPVATLTVMQVLNAALAGAGAVLFARVLRLLSGDAVLAAAGGGLLAASFGYWYFANGEIHHWGLVLILTIFLLVVRRRLGGPPGAAYGFAGAIGFGNALAIVFHQDAVLFGFAVVAMLVVDRPWRPALKEAAAYVVAGSVGTAALAVWVGVFVRGVGSVREFFQWYFWPTWHMGVGVYDVGGVTGSVLRSLKAQLTAVVYGTQVALDVAREPALLREPVAIWLLALTLVAYGVAAWLALRLWRERRAVRASLSVPLVGCVVWLAVYKVFLNSWFQPASTEYHIATVPPLLLLVLLGLIAAPAGPTHDQHRLRRNAPVMGLLAIFFVVNFYGAILPWRRYGGAKQALFARFEPELRAGDRFISSESGIDSVFIGRGRHLGVKDLFKQKPKTEGFVILDQTIGDGIRRPGRVFIYNFVPNSFTLRRINLESARRGDPSLSFADFERFMSELRARYVVVPVASYWEESKIPLFLYGRRFETIWEIKAASSPTSAVRTGEGAQRTSAANQRMQ
jgi:hypothetical protein